MWRLFLKDSFMRFMYEHLAATDCLEAGKRLAGYPLASHFHARRSGLRCSRALGLLHRSKGCSLPELVRGLAAAPSAQERVRR
jgi:hypothetical protein